MTDPHYIPDAGDIVWLHFDPQSGHEQAGHRPALVLTPREYGKHTHLMICCPLTSTVRNNGLEVKVPRGTLEGDFRDSVVMVSQVKTMDFRARKTKFAVRAPTAVVQEVKAKLAAILEID